MLADNMTGKVLPDQSPAHLLLEGLTEGSLLDWDLTILRSLPEAASVMGADTIQYVEFFSAERPMPFM